jgi:DNA-binding transcriptional ArsR family regulator
MMNNSIAADILSQLGNSTRLEITRLLVRAGEKGMLVGELQKSLKIPASTLSHHLNALKSVGLVSQERLSNQLLCQVNYQTIDSIVEFLTAECCAGNI